MKDLLQSKGKSVVVAGDQQAPAVHVLAHAMNAALGNVGTTVVYTDPVEANPVDHVESLRTLVADMDAGKVDMLVVLGGNPVYTAPADIPFKEKLAKVALRVHLASHFNETSAECQWHVPETHYLEAWSDGRAYDGTVSVAQPLIAPLYDGKSTHDLLAAFSAEPSRSGYDVVRGYWRKQFAAGAVKPVSPAEAAAVQKLAGTDGESAFELFWRKVLNDGVMPNTAHAPVSVAFSGTVPAIPAAQSGAMEIVFKLDPTVYDGRYANNGWLQELPKPVTRLTWDNAVLISPATAERLGIGVRYAYQGGEHGQSLVDMAELTFEGRTLKAPVSITPGMPDDCAMVTLGYGRTRAGKVGDGTGVNANTLRTATALWSGAGLQMKKVDGTFHLATVGAHYNMEGRGFVQVATLEEFRKNPRFVDEEAESPAADDTLYPPDHLVRRVRLGHEHRPERLHRLQRLRHRLPGREQHPGRRQGAGAGRARDALDPGRPLLRGRAGRTRSSTPAGAVHAVRERAVRGGLPGGGDRAQLAKG